MGVRFDILWGGVFLWKEIFSGLLFWGSLLVDGGDIGECFLGW